MLDVAIKIIEKIIWLLNRREIKKKQLFNEIIEPLFLDLTTIHKDYRNVFFEVEDLLRDTSIPEKLIIHKLEKRKRELQLLRQKVLALGEMYEKEIVNNIKLSNEVEEFLNLVVYYFHIGVGKAPPRRLFGTYYTTLLSTINDIGFNSRENCLFEVKSMRDEIESRFADITIAYARAKIINLK